MRRLAPLRDHAVGDDTGVMYAPGGPYRREWASLAQARDLDAWCVVPLERLRTDRRQAVASSTRRGSTTSSGRRRQARPSCRGRRSSSCSRSWGSCCCCRPWLRAAAVAGAAGGQRPDQDRRSSLAIEPGLLIVEVMLIQQFVLAFLSCPARTYVVLFSLLPFAAEGGGVPSRPAGLRQLLVGAYHHAMLITLARRSSDLLDGAARPAVPFAGGQAIMHCSCQPVPGTASPVRLAWLCVLFRRAMGRGASTG